MELNWLKKEGNPSCVLFLAGWGMAPEPFRAIPVGDHDLLMVHDYRQVAPQAVMEQVRGYADLHLAAWSMGVWVAGKFFAEYRNCFGSASAVNGTLQPIDAQCGLPPGAFDAMIDNFSPAVLDRFYRDMFDQTDQAERFLRCRPDRPGESILEELQALRKMYHDLGPGTDIFSRRIVGSRDRIFTARAQLKSWGKERCERVKAAHFPFYEWTPWATVTGGGLTACI